MTVVLHELGHGLNFFGSGVVDDGSAANGVECAGTSGIGCWGFGTAFPSIYDRFTESPLGSTIIGDYPNPSVSLAGAMTDNQLVWVGTAAMEAHGGPVPLYAPAMFSRGSSISHLNESSFPAGDPNSLMTPAVGNAEAIHSPGPVTLRLFQDQGWTTTGCAGIFSDGFESGNTGAWQ
ncbi:MAG: hypothetical protein K8J08_06590 [Thermoanaerobaculia bacterium]|nr:hypothetical protein [Thermoanaerobaculia bacterium]